MEGGVCFKSVLVKVLKNLFWHECLCQSTLCVCGVYVCVSVEFAETFIKYIGGWTAQYSPSPPLPPVHFYFSTALIYHYAILKY